MKPEGESLLQTNERGWPESSVLIQACWIDGDSILLPLKSEGPSSEQKPNERNRAWPASEEAPTGTHDD